MKMFLLGVERRSGTAKASGRPFDFTQVHAAAPVELIAKENFSLQGSGFRPVVLNANSEGLEMLAGLTLPGWFECEIGTSIGMNGEMIAQLIGVKGGK